MDYFQGVVTEYLRANRCVFVNTECLLQLEVGDTPAKGRHWYCDAVAVNLQESRAFLCEVTFSSSLSAVINRLQAWYKHWPELRTALARDCSIPETWHVQPWVFIPQERESLFERKIGSIAFQDIPSEMPRPKVTPLESVTPWKYRSWNGKAYSKKEGGA